MVKTITVNAGKILMRRQPVSHGSAHGIHKRTSHIFVELGEGIKKSKVKKEKAKEKTVNKTAKNKMTHTVHPYSHRLGIIRDWKSRWFGVKSKYLDFLKSDVLLRDFWKKDFAGSMSATLKWNAARKLCASSSKHLVRA